MNRGALKEAMKRKKITKRAAAAALGITEAAFYYKLSGGSEFKESEIRTLALLLKLGAGELYELVIDG